MDSNKTKICTECEGSGLLKVTRFGVDTMVSDEEACPFCNGGGWLTRDEAAGNAAIKTLEQLGYEYNGGEYWKPPIKGKEDARHIDVINAEAFAQDLRNRSMKANMDKMAATIVKKEWDRIQASSQSSSEKEKQNMGGLFYTIGSPLAEMSTTIGVPESPLLDNNGVPLTTTCTTCTKEKNAILSE